MPECLRSQLGASLLMVLHEGLPSDVYWQPPSFSPGHSSIPRDSPQGSFPLPNWQQNGHSEGHHRGQGWMHLHQDRGGKELMITGN